MQLVNGIDDDGSMVGNNPVLEDPPNQEGGLISPGTTSYTLYAEKEGVFLVKSDGVHVRLGRQPGARLQGLFGQVIVEPAGAAIYRGQVFEEEMRLAADRTERGRPGGNGQGTRSSITRRCTRSHGDAAGPRGEGGAPDPEHDRKSHCSDATHCEIVHSEINAVVAHGPTAR